MSDGVIAVATAICFVAVIIIVETIAVCVIKTIHETSDEHIQEEIEKRTNQTK
jgi:hypothetical protein